MTSAYDDAGEVMACNAVDPDAHLLPSVRAGFDDQWIFYLLDGEIEIADDNVRNKTKPTGHVDSGIGSDENVERPKVIGCDEFDG